MKILFFAKNFFSPKHVSGGMENYLFNLINKLKYSHEISLLIPRKYNLTVRNVKIYYYYEVNVPILESIVAFISLLLILPKILIKDRPDVISAFIPSFASSIVFGISKLWRIRTIINLRGSWDSSNFLLVFLGGLTFLFSDQIVMNSPTQHHSYANNLYIPQKIFTKIPKIYIPNAIESQFWTPIKSNISKIHDIVYVANLHSETRIQKKGFAELIRSVTIFKEKYGFMPKTLIIGKYNEHLISKYIKSIPIDLITFTDEIKNKNLLKNKMLSAKIFVLSSNIEGMPNSLMQAMALGLPCIATNVGAVNLLIKNGLDGLIVEKRNCEEIAQKIDFLLNKPKEMEKISKNARIKMINDFSWSNIEKEVIKAYNLPLLK